MTGAASPSSRRPIGRCRSAPGRVRALATTVALLGLMVAGFGAVQADAARLTGTVPTITGRTTARADVVRTDLGLVRGEVSSDHRRFSTIPYAAPPVGALRFRAPQPAAAWSGVRDTTGSPAACPQSTPVVGTLLPSQEDCLTLDVYTPPVGRTGLPVMVWFYGGGYVLGATGSDPMPLIRTGRVIVVEVNYRLGPFGFLSLPGLDAESPNGTSGNAGLLDQQAGLRWVQRNIAAFGGDPSNVTIFGESAGGNSVCQQVASPLARGLFAKAISQSGACSGAALRTVPKADMVARSRTFAAELGCTDPGTALACLRRLPASKLLSSKTVQFTSMALTWQPSIDGYVEPRNLDDAWATGNFAHVPMIIGNNHDEGRLFVFLFDHLQTLQPVSAAGYTDFVRRTFGRSADQVLARYPVSAYDSPDLAEAAVITDAFFACPAAWSTQRLTAAGQRVRAYQLATVDPPLQIDPYLPLGNAHFLDLFYLFDSIQQIPLLPLPVTRDDTQAELSTQIVDAWTSFAATGDPNGTAGVGGVSWPAWAPGGQVLQLDAVGNRVITDLASQHDCGFWEPLRG
jgi:para-nitrobenzyl esterase